MQRETKLYCAPNIWTHLYVQIKDGCNDRWGLGKSLSSYCITCYYPSKCHAFVIMRINNYMINNTISFHFELCPHGQTLRRRENASWTYIPPIVKNLILLLCFLWLLLLVIITTIGYVNHFHFNDVYLSSRLLLNLCLLFVCLEPLPLSTWELILLFLVKD